MMWGDGTVPPTSGNCSCSTGCPTCGCSNPNCRYTGTFSTGLNDILFLIEPRSAIAASDMAVMVEDIKREAAKQDRPWVAMKRKMPRDQKSPCRVMRQPPAHRRACY